MSSRNRGLGLLFLDAAKQAFRRLRDGPLQFPFVSTDVRRALGEVSLPPTFSPGVSVYLPQPVAVLILMVAMLARGAVLKYRVAFRRASVAVVVLCTVVILMPARVGESDRTESGAIAIVRAIMSGEFAYASLNQGFYDTLECLDSASCAPGVRGHAPFLAPELATTKERGGYRFEFHAGPRADSESDPRMSQSRMTRFAVIATPLNPGAQHHSFCGDDRGSIYFTSDGAVPAVDAGRCLDTQHSVADLRPAGR